MATVNGDETETAKRILALLNELALGVVFTCDDFDFTKFKGGFVSDIYRVTFKTVKAPVPQTIVVKFFNYVAKEECGYEIVTSQLNCLFIGEADLGPRILLIKPDAIVMEYFAGEPLTGKDDEDPAIREDMARKLARLHALTVPIARNDHLDKMGIFFNIWMGPELTDALYSGPFRPILERLGLPHLLSNTIRSDVLLVEKAIRESEATATLVFSHADVTHLNTLVIEDPVTNKRSIKFIDFDLSGYFFRGVDLGRYVYDCKQPKLFHPVDLIPDETIHQFLAWYREECSIIHGLEYLEDPRNSFDALLKETKLFAQFSFLIDALFCVCMALDIVKSKGKEAADEEKVIQFLKQADQIYGVYLKVKARLL